ncbi:MAG: fatty-acyl-CoA synthase [Actinomycetota bacterium]|jgi:fatty-acyl-CoA synthase|nr:fatty-acyl-CoA synthase [Actinomycetota bacterium]
MAGPLDGLKQVGDLAHPRTVKRLLGAGLFSARSPFALATALPYLLGRGPSLGILSQMNAVALRSKIAIHDRDGSITFGELDQEANRVSYALRRAGLKGGDRFGLLMRNGRHMAAVAFGAQKAGYIACPLNTWAKTKELKAVLENLEPTMLFYDTAHSDEVQKVVSEDMTIVHVGDPSKAAPNSVSFEEFIEDAPPTPPFPLTRDRGSAKVIIQTSGTTGTPKGASRDASAAGIGALANLLGSVPYRRDDIVFCPAPLFHSFGLATFTFATALGATLVLPPKFDPEESLALIEEHGATVASFVPVMMRRIVSLPDKVKKKYDLSSLRIVIASGSVLSQDLKNEARKLFGDVLYDLYGSTEIGWVAIATPEDIEKKPRSVGKPVDGIEIGVFSEDGEQLPTGETGELYVKSKVLFEGYTSGESKDERDGYMSIGDLGKLDEDGYLYVESRSDDMVVVGGENVYPVEVEEVIENIEGVNEVTVLGVEDDEYGHVLAAFVVGNVTPEKVKSACKSELASFKVPRKVKVVKELPRTSTGKVLKRELAEQI